MSTQSLRKFLLLLSVIVVLLLDKTTSRTVADEPDTRPPNILMIFLDDFGWKDASYTGSDFYETPNIDALASQGKEITNVASSNLAIVEELFLELRNWQTQTNAAIPRALNPAFDEAKEKAAIEKLTSQAGRKHRSPKNQKAGS